MPRRLHIMNLKKWALKRNGYKQLKENGARYFSMLFFFLFKGCIT